MASAAPPPPPQPGPWAEWRQGHEGGFAAPPHGSVLTSAEFVKRLRYCEYLGKYFCDCCHSYAESCIPARMLARWDFRKYYVSNFSKQLLDSIWHQPLVNVLNVSRSPCLVKARKLDAVTVSSWFFGGPRGDGSRQTLGGPGLPRPSRGWS